MIGSTLSRLSMADKLSIPQLQQAVQDGTIPAYVGVPLLQEKVKQAQQAKALSTPAAEPTPIAQQVMQEAQGLTAAESNLPEFTAFDGGIVAFARGDLVEDDEDYGLDLDFSRDIGVRHPFEDEVIRAALARGEDPRSALEILRRETSPTANAARAISPKGATGIMQIMPSTAMQPGFGVPNIFDLADSKGIAYGDRSEGSAKELLKNPALNADFGVRYRAAMENRFGNPQLAAAAYNAGPGAVQRAGGIPDIAETKKYVAGISPDRFEAASKSVRAARREQLGLPPEGAPSAPLGSTFDPFLDATNIPYEGEPAPKPGIPGAAEAIDRVTEITREGVKRDQARQEAVKEAAKESAKQAEEAAKESAKEAKTTPEKIEKEEKKDALAESLKRYEDRLAKRRDEDKYMAILAAGLGMMSGTSPYASANIGAGAMKGIETAAALAKERGLEERGLLRGQIEQAKSLESGELRKQLRADELRKSYVSQISRDYDAAVKAALARRKVASLDELLTPADQQAVLREANQSLIDNPGFQEAYRQIYGKEYSPASASYRVIGVKKGS